MLRGDDLARIPLFADLDATQLDELAGWFEVKKASTGTKLTGEGAPGYSFFVIADGTAAVTSGDEPLAELGPGDFFGERAIVGDGRRTATVTASSPAQVYVMFGTEFRQLQQNYPDVAARIEAGR